MLKLPIVFVILTLVLAQNAEAKGVANISGKEIKNRPQLYGQLARELKFPAYFSNNLDSLYDVLISDARGNNIIKIKNLNLLKAKLGEDFTEDFIRTILDASEENARLILVLE